MGITTSIGRIVSLWSLLFAASAFAQANEQSVNLTEEDQFAHRAVTVTRVDNTQLAGVLSVTTYDPAAKTFVIETALQGTVRMSAKDIHEFAFTQSLKESSPQAQTCPWTVTARPGSIVTIKVPGASLRIEKGKLVVNSPDVPQLLEPGTMLEAQRIAYDRRRDEFTVALQQVGYELKVQSCGGGGRDPGESKPIQ
jgi:hypothetical protein